MQPIVRSPAAWLPLALSGAALALIVGYVAAFGVATVPGADEGTPARLFQLIIAVEALVIAAFVLRWLPVRPREALPILALQALAFVLPIALIAILES